MKKISVFIIGMTVIFLGVFCFTSFSALAKIPAKVEDKAAVGRKVQFIRDIYAIDDQGKPDLKSMPKGVAIGPQGKLFAIFLARYEVQVFNPEGKFLYRFGKKGVEEGEFWLPISIEVADNGTAFVLDGHLNKIVVFSPEGEFQYEFSFRKRRSPGDKKLMRCTKMGLDRKNNILYLSDSANSNIKLFSLKGDALGIFPWDTKKAGLLSVPSKISFDAPGNIYIPDFINGKVHVFDAKKNYLYSIGDLGDRLGNLVRPIAAFADQKGNIYILDRVISAIQIFNAEGKVLGIIKDTEVAEGLRFTRPFDMAVNDKGVFYLSSQSMHCIKVLKELGN